MTFIRNLVVLTVTTIPLGSVACAIGETRREVIDYDPHTASQTLTCNSKFVKVDTNGLKACKGELGMGKGFCYDKTKVDLVGDNYVDPACDKSEYCVPRKHFTLGGDKAKTCDFSGKPGACASLVATEMAQSAVALQQGPCDDDEKCSPCIDPRNGKPSGVCEEIGIHEEPCGSGKSSSGITLCCAGLGLCLDARNVPGGAADELPTDSCKDDKVCAPASLVDGKPQKCDAVGGLDGVCLPFCFAEMVRGAQAGLRSTCNALSFCLPCAAAKSQGMHMPGCE